MSMTPPKSNAGTPQRPIESTGQKRDDLMAFSDEDEDDEEGVKAKEAQMLEDDLLSPVTSDIGSDVERAAMEKELEEQGLIRKPEGTPSKRSRASRTGDGNGSGKGNGKEKEKGGKGKKDQSLPESEIVARWNRTIGDVCQVGDKS